ncbi:hypothetical protein GLAREA_11545 [Glarea lozoyensis ATCC 20868]|uniref:Uncharacterized protein n=1 Tax=Glarea lozoyensis (strain ATCC 20868 / MF5171) TaxID=1116229 RepID=S3CI68_GLAL2|nr:uncharacterized protein GLAREA_11545 [Glarea lozoyensis ATCC 20868]EPE24964.1 hypothetical protein GLAREA_11545 [Glarea lozoyensis ATCC 20868]
MEQEGHPKHKAMRHWLPWSQRHGTVCPYRSQVHVGTAMPLTRSPVLEYWNARFISFQLLGQCCHRTMP